LPINKNTNELISGKTPRYQIELFVSDTKSRGIKPFILNKPLHRKRTGNLPKEINIFEVNIATVRVRYVKEIEPL